MTVFARSTIAYMYSMGYSFISKDADDLLIFNMNNSGAIRAYERIRDLLFNDNVCHDVETMPYDGYPHPWRNCEAMFGGRQILFYAEAMQNAERFRLRDTLRILHHEVLINIVDSKPLPNFFVYQKPWYRDGSMMAMVLKETSNLHLIDDWVVGSTACTTVTTLAVRNPIIWDNCSTYYR